MTAVRFTAGGRGYTVTFAYNPAVVALIKDTVPGYARSWVAGRKVWEVDDGWGEALAAMLRGKGHTVIGLESRQRQQPSGSPAEPSQWARLMFRRLGPTRRAAAYRALSKVLHPDTPTGDTALQRELNDAHDQVK